MENENYVIESESEQNNVDGVDYISALNDMKKNTVSKEAYNKLAAENKRLVQSLVNGEEITIQEKEPVNVDEIRKKLFNTDTQLNNYEYVKAALELREELIRRGEKDPFLPSGSKVMITQDMIDTAERTANVLKDCIDFADGDSGIFTAELQRRTIDVMPQRRNR